VLDLILGYPIQKQDHKFFIGNRIYFRNSITAGISFADGCLVLAGCLYYPPDYNGLHYDRECHPIREVREALKSKHGGNWLDYYRKPNRNHYDIIAEYFFTSLTDLEETMDQLRKFETRFCCGNWEQDFAYKTGSVMPVNGDKTYFNALAEQIRQDPRCQTSDACKRILSKDEGMLLALGIALASLENAIFDEGESVYEDSTFAESYL